MTALAAVPDTTETKELAAAAEQLVVSATALAITDAASYENAAEFGKGIKSLQKRIVDFFAPMKKKAHESWKQICDTERRELTPTEKAEQIVKAKMLVFQRSERQRQDDELRQRELSARKLEEDRRIEEALDLDESGDRAGAENLLSAPVETPVLRVPIAPAPKIAGVATVKRWTFDENVDLAAVLRHVVGVPAGQALAHPELLRVVAVDTKVVRQLVTAMRDSFHVPGIRAYESDSVSLGSK